MAPLIFRVLIARFRKGTRKTELHWRSGTSDREIEDAEDDCGSAVSSISVWLTTVDDGMLAAMITITGSGWGRRRRRPFYLPTRGEKQRCSAALTATHSRSRATTKHL